MALGSWRRRVKRAIRRARFGHRRVWAGTERAYVEVRPPGQTRDPAAFEAELCAALEALPGIRWARLNHALGRVVVAFEAELTIDAVRQTTLVDTVEAVERRFGLRGECDWHTRHAFPGDHEPALRFATEMGADSLGFGAGLVMRALGVETVPAEVGLAAMLSLAEVVPQIRERIEAKLGPETTDLAFNAANALSQALVQGTTGPVVDAFGRILRLRERTAQLDAWTAAEPELGGRPEAHAGGATKLEREAPLPRGPIEHYTSRVLSAAGGGFGFSFIASRDLSEAMVPVFSGVPKPALHGREAFAAGLGKQLAERGVIVMDPEALRLLDRVDCVVVPAELLRPRAFRVEAIVALGGFNRRDARRNAMRMLDLSDPRAVRDEGKWRLAPLAATGPRSLGEPDGGEHSDEVAAAAARLREPGGLILALQHRGAIAALIALIPTSDPAVEGFAAALRRADLQLICAGEIPEERGWVEPDRVVEDGEQLAGSIRRLQADGHGVWLICDGALGRAGVPVADLSLDLDLRRAREPEQSPAWGAELIAAGGFSDAAHLAEAVAAAKQVARHSVYLAAVEAASGLILAVGGQRSKIVKRVMTASNAASLMAMANGLRLVQGVESTGGAVSVDPTPWHALETEEVLRRLASSGEGLSAAEAELRREPRPPPPSPFELLTEMLFEELANPLAPVLAAGAGLSALTGALIDAGMIAGVVALNAGIGAAQRYKTSQALELLDASEGEQARVRRRPGGAASSGEQEEQEERGELVDLDPDLLVPGDLLVLEAGDSVLADARILEARGLELDESSLTGESLPVSKDAAPSFANAVADRRSMVFEGTTVAAGTCVAVVTAVGDETEARRALQRRDHGRGAKATGVEARLEALTEFTAPLAALSGAALMTAGLSMKQPPAEIVSSGVSLAVAAVPEGLPLLATMAQLAAARRLSERGALVRNPRAIEALGRTNVLCADKTGTLTEGRIRLRMISDGAREAEPEALTELARDDGLVEILRAALRASPVERSEALPHATDRALVDGAHAAGLHRHADEHGFSRISELPFEPARGYHAVHGEIDGRHLVAIKGAPEQVLPLCTARRDSAGARELDEGGRRALVEAAEALAGRGLRVLAVAEREIPARERLADRHVIELRFLGFAAFADPVRPSARGAIEDLHKAGVDVVMITGDHPHTARAIAEELGLFREPATEVLTGPELDELDDAALDARIEAVAVVARVTPSQKVRIVQSLQRRGRVVAMTGDGANDAPAIRLADVGVALGERATPAARKAADVVVTDERIETLVDAVLEGRALWRSVRDAVALLVGGNLGEIAFTVVGGLVEGRSPLNARQLLLVNMLTDTLPALAVALRRPRHADPEELMKEGPEASLGSALDRDIAWRAAVTASSTTAAWLVARVLGTRARADTVALLTLVGSQLGQTLAVGGRDPTVLAAGLGSGLLLLACVETPGVSHFFGSRPLGPLGLSQALLASAAGTGVAVLGPPMIDWLRDQGWLSEGDGDDDEDQDPLEAEELERHRERLNAFIEAAGKLVERVIR